MPYRNWENGGMSNGEIRDKLLDGMNGGKTFKALYNSCYRLLENMIKEIENTDTIPYNKITWSHNYLFWLKDRINDCLKEADNDLLFDTVSEWTIHMLVSFIDENENKTLEYLRYVWSNALLRIIGQKSGSNWIWENDWTTIRIKWNSDKTLNNLGLFNDYTITEDDYVWEGTTERSGTVSDRRILGKFSEYIFDYRDCDETTKAKVHSMLNWQLWEVVVNGNKDKVSNGGDFSEYDFSSENRIVVRVDEENGQYYLRRRPYDQWDNSRFSLSSATEWLPIVSNLRISEKSWYLAGIWHKANEEIEKYARETLYIMDWWDWEISPENKEEFRKYLSFFPLNSKIKSRLKCWESTKSLDKEHSLAYFYNRFIVATENRVRQFVRTAQRCWYHKWYPPITMNSIFEKWTWSINLRSKNFDSNFERNIWDSDGNGPINKDKENMNIWKELYNLLSSSKEFKNEYLEYLTNSIESKWDEAKEIIPQERLIKEANEPNDVVKPEDAEKYIRKLNLLKPIFDDAASNKNNETVAELAYIINTAIKELSTTNNLSKSSFKNNIYHRICDLITDDIKSLNHHVIDSVIINIFYWKDDKEVEDAVRTLSKWYDYAWNQEQAYRLAEERNPDWTRRAQVKDTEINKCLNKVDELFELNEDDIKIDENWNLVNNSSKKLKIIQDLYDVVNGKEYNVTYYQYKNEVTGLPTTWLQRTWANKWPEWIYWILVNSGIIPDWEDFIYREKTEIKTQHEWTTVSTWQFKYKENKNIQSICENIFNALKSKQAAAEKIPEPTLDTEKIKRQTRYDKLNKHSWLKDDERRERDNLEMLLNNEDLAKEAIENAKITTKHMKYMTYYSDINNLIYNNLLGYYWDKGWWTNNNIINSIKWFWFLYVSDENTETLKEIAFQIAFNAATWYLWGPALTALNNMGRIGKWVATIQKWFKKLQTILNTRFWKLGSTFIAEATKDNVENFVVQTWMWNNPFEKLTSGWDKSLLVSFKKSVWEAIFGSDAYRVFSRWSWQLINKEVVKLPNILNGVLNRTVKTVSRDSFLNLTFWRKNPDWTFSHDLWWDTHMVANVAGAVFWHCINRINNTATDRTAQTINDIMEKSANGTFTYYWDSSERLYVQNTRNNKSVDLTDYNAFEKLEQNGKA